MATIYSHMNPDRAPKLRRPPMRSVMAMSVCCVVALLAMWPSAARAWWNDDWQLRKKITIDASATGAAITDEIGGAPVLIRLHTGNFRFASAKEDGSDLRFIAGDDKTPLKHHVEKFDALLGEALVWVAVPRLAAGAKTDVWLYFGNKKAVPTFDAKGTYDPDTLLIYHFAERGTPALDSSVWANNAQSIGQLADGALIGNGLRLDGRTPLTLPATPSLALADNATFTWSAWVKASALQPSAALYSRHDAANGLVIGLDSGVPFVEVTNSGTVQRSGPGAPVAPGGWHHVAVVADGGQIGLYLDGAPYASLAARLPALNSIALIGGDTAAASAAPAVAATSDASAATPAADADAPVAPAAATAMSGFAGDIDELQIGKIARSSGFIKFAAIEQGPDPSKLVVFSLDEETGSWLSGYCAVILKSVTLDGWVVIGILVVMAALSWVVMYDRLSYLNGQSRANERFMELFRAGSAGAASSDALVTLTEADARKLRASSLLRIYQLGSAELDKRLRGRTSVLSAASIASIRAALDAGFVKETQRLNRLMVVLTIAISGGPFLGLLGTVVGVMITFAAIAAAGDVNVNAPGIAAALVATVAGLGVAIPALFGYNYLISRVKDLTSDMQVFIDELVSRMAEYHAGERIERQAAE